MTGKMRHKPLLISDMLDYARRIHGDTEIVSVDAIPADSKPYYVRTSWSGVARRSARLANALGALAPNESNAQGITFGTLSSNNHRHLELYFGIPGSGHIIHTINPRMGIEKISYSINKADDRVVFFDPEYTELVKEIQSLCEGVSHWVMLAPQALPVEDGFLSYEKLIQAESDQFDWPVFDEVTPAAICFTSGTTGRPKGVVYNHRSVVIHTMMLNNADVFGFRARDNILPVVPMYHVNAWGIPYAAAICGAKLVLPSHDVSGEALNALIRAEKVSVTAGVPLVLRRLLDTAKPGDLDSLQRCFVGGADCPVDIVNEFKAMNIPVTKTWGMTELSPLGAVDTEKNASSGHAQGDRETTGRPQFGISLTILDDDGKAQPWDGLSQGELVADGHWTIDSYLGDDDHGREAWFRTGDIAAITPGGYIKIKDRKKDMIKSGGEWISSIELERIANVHRQVRSSCAIAVPSEHWGERPLLFVESQPNTTLNTDEVKALYCDKVPKWAIPDRVIQIEAIPLNPNGKIEKTKLRQWLAEGKFH